MGKLKIDMQGQASPGVARLVRIAAKATFIYFNYDFDAMAEISFVDAKRIKKLNSEHRMTDKVTDVLSFPAYDFKEGVPPKDMISYPNGLASIGDIVICVDTARAQAETFGHSFARECAYLTVHSTLHLLGFDHVDEGQNKATMRAYEEAILARLGLSVTH